MQFKTVCFKLQEGPNSVFNAGIRVLGNFFQQPLFVIFLPLWDIAVTNFSIKYNHGAYNVRILSFKNEHVRMSDLPSVIYFFVVG